jgi:hypothetical protein
MSGLPRGFALTLNGRRVSGERGAEGDERVRCTRVLGRSPLKAEAVPVRILDRQLLHTVVSDDWLLNIEAQRSEIRVRSVHVSTAEE